jgi:hypothetical protein
MFFLHSAVSRCEFSAPPEFGAHTVPSALSAFEIATLAASRAESGAGGVNAQALMTMRVSTSMPIRPTSELAQSGVLGSLVQFVHFDVSLVTGLCGQHLVCTSGCVMLRS